MRQIKSTKVFFSVFQNNRPHLANLDNHRTIVNSLYNKGISLIEVNGVYSGIPEKSILIQSTDVNEFEKLKNIAYEVGAQFNQESVLIVHNDDVSELKYLKNGELTKIGVFTEVTKNETVDKDHSEIDGRYFIIK